MAYRDRYLIARSVVCTRESVGFAEKSVSCMCSDCFHGISPGIKQGWKNGLIAACAFRA